MHGRVSEPVEAMVIGEEIEGQKVLVNREILEEAIEGGKVQAIPEAETHARVILTI